MFNSIAHEWTREKNAYLPQSSQSARSKTRQESANCGGYSHNNLLTQVLSSRLCAFALNSLIYLCVLRGLCGEKMYFFVSLRLCAR